MLPCDFFECTQTMRKRFESVVPMPCHAGAAHSMERAGCGRTCAISVDLWLAWARVVPDENGTLVDV